MKNPFDEYFSYNPREDLENFSKVPTEAWLKIGEQKALENFQLVSKVVPAYRDFLKKHKINPEKIKTIDDFKQLPLTTKDNYFKKYPLNMLVMGGDLGGATTIHSSSGSTGKSFYFPKSPIQDINIYKGVELLLVYYFDIDKINTLLINCFGMGPWPAGEIVHTSTKMMGEKGLKISVISPGLHKDLFFDFFKDLASNFEQVILAGYQSSLRDLVSEGVRRGIKFNQHNIKILTGGEIFSEDWRTYMSNHLGFKSPYKSIASVLGTAETGVTAFSTPFTDNLRIFLNKNSSYLKRFFAKNDLPSIVQFIPPARFVEIIKDEIVVTCLGLVPLTRYNSRDYGQILRPKDVLASTPNSFQNQYNSYKEPYGIPNIPILAIHGRSDGVITLYALNIYSDQIAQILEIPRLKRYLTCRAIIEKLETGYAKPYLKLTLELKPGFAPLRKLSNNIQEITATELAKINSEYAHLLSVYGNKVKPLIELKEYGSNEVVSKTGKGVSVRK